MKLLFLIIFCAAIFVLIVFVDIAAGLFTFFYNHKCPHCGVRMKFLYKKEIKGGVKDKLYIFQCPYCGKKEEITTKDMLLRYHDGE